MKKRDFASLYFPWRRIYIRESGIPSEVRSEASILRWIPGSVEYNSISADILLLGAHGDNAVLSFIPQLYVIARPFTAIAWF